VALSGSALNPVLLHAIGINKITVFHVVGYIRGGGGGGGRHVNTGTPATKLCVLLIRMKILSLYGIRSFCLPANNFFWY